MDPVRAARIADELDAAAAHLDGGGTIPTARRAALVKALVAAGPGAIRSTAAYVRGAAGHVAVAGPGQVCAVDGQPWPCDMETQLRTWADDVDRRT